MQARARVLLTCDAASGGPRWTNVRVAEAVEVSARTVARVRTTYATQGLDAARQRKRAERVYARRLDGADAARRVALACTDALAGHARWSVRLLARRLVELGVMEAIAPETVRQALKETNSNRGSCTASTSRPNMAVGST
ncbi:MAG: helix-turn-helix domain-containing protein [Thermomicrobiales bacterium]|nr:helix-turn-helix domain-containing protein [Thermomicrobiales bacterium]